MPSDHCRSDHCRRRRVVAHARGTIGRFSSYDAGETVVACVRDALKGWLVVLPVPRRPFESLLLHRSYIHTASPTTTPWPGCQVNEMIMLLLALFTLLAASAEAAVVYPQVRQNPLMCVLRASLLQPDSLCIWLCIWLLLTVTGIVAPAACLPACLALDTACICLSRQPANGWTHAWPYDATNAVLVSHNITVTAAGSSSVAADGLLDTILTRYQMLLRNKVSAAGRSHGAPSDTYRGVAELPVLSNIDASVTGAGDEALVLGPDTDESYTCVVRVDDAGAAKATVTAASVYGLRHGLETLSQLVVTPTGIIVGVNATSDGELRIEDKPAFAYRGLMIGPPP
jgi:hypothetical protein